MTKLDSALVRFLIESYDRLRKRISEPDAMNGHSDPDLGTLRAGIVRLHLRWGVVVGLSVTLFRAALRRAKSLLEYEGKLVAGKDPSRAGAPDAQVENHSENANPGKPSQKGRADIVLDDSTEDGAGFLGLRTLAPILTILAAVGVTFSWNVGAIVSFLFALAVTYISWNLGFLFVLISKSRRESLALATAFVFLQIVVSAPWILRLVRGFD